MNARRLVERTLAACLVLCLCLGSAAEDDPLAAPHAFDDGLTLAKDALDTGAYQEALDGLKLLFEAHKKKNYVKGRRHEIEDLVRRLACGTQFKPPKAKDVVSGKLQQWSPKTGKIRIVYTPKTLEDFDKRDGVLYLPARLNGSFTLEIKGKAYLPDAKSPPQMVLGGDQHPETGEIQTWTVGFGVPPRSRKAKSAMPATLVHQDGDEKHTLATKKKAPGKFGKPFKLVLKVSKTKVSAKFGGSTIGSGKKHPAVWGYLGFRVGSWTEAKLTGTIDTSWIEGMVEEIFRGQLDEFEKTYEASKYIPRWLSEPLTKERRRTRSVNPVARLDEKFSDALMEVYNGVRLDEFDSALSWIDKMQAQGAPEVACEYLRAETRVRMVELEKALVHASRAVALEPAYVDAVVMQGELLRQLGRWEDALEAFEQSVAGKATSARAYKEAASAMLKAGRPADAKRLTQLAARNGVTSDDLVKLNDALGKAVNGPRWRRRFQHKSQNYHVMADIDQTTCVEAANLLEEAFQAYRERFAWVARDKTRLFKVFVFSDRAGFMAYQGDLEEFMGKPSEMAAGLYTPLLKQLLIWTHADRTEVLNTVRHEGFHQYLDRVMPDPPVWFNEGLAVYHENGIKVDGKLTFGQMHPGYIRLLRARGLEPLSKFLYITPALFYETGHRSYGQAWLLVHMLQHTTPDYMAFFKGLIEDLKTKPAYLVMRNRFPAARLPKLDEDLKAYLEKLAGN